MIKINTYRYLEDIAPADAAIEACAENLEILFAIIAEAVFGIIVDIAGVESEIEREIEVEADDLESLLFNWLAELIFYKDKYIEFYNQFEVQIDSENCKLKSIVRGEKIDSDRHEVKVDVKAVTYYKLSIEKLEDCYRGFIVVDL